MYPIDKPVSPLRRRFLIQSGTLLAAAPLIASMPHVILLGDSIFDNASYTGGKPAVIDQVKNNLPAGWKVTLLAVDGATTEGIPAQLARLPADATHLVLSVGGNNALMRQEILDKPVRSSAEAFTLFARTVQEFEAAYRKAIAACMKPSLPLVICTIYNGRFPDPAYQQRVNVAIAGFDDAIIRVGVEKQLKTIELRQICTSPEDYANPIEPSSVGGEKIARAIVKAVTEPVGTRRGAQVVAG
ncbi:MAG TPA: SGNH/GDSL hydrolase family protein [Noviherbaspirillum sp.]|jgi:hypothetical protein|uniref:SGNH/GDSL hydrolase family protein n=1 Tax=Noviherbaspirillum sp. TaxID=1926288 RepID=UPI002DDD3506|nr:SGNH/GDSL hydrolase family protein [Noviherbaspirillum sp.]HEV2611359.1 SGNH/GDSL hydrolase family protein [Noviherbaspirillum sp.]